LDLQHVVANVFSLVGLVQSTSNKYSFCYFVTTSNFLIWFDSVFFYIDSSVGCMVSCLELDILVL
jgi:hypothetical protein